MISGRIELRDKKITHRRHWAAAKIHGPRQLAAEEDAPGGFDGDGSRELRARVTEPLAPSLGAVRRRQLCNKNVGRSGGAQGTCSKIHGSAEAPHHDDIPALIHGDIAAKLIIRRVTEASTPHMRT